MGRVFIKFQNVWGLREKERRRGRGRDSLQFKADIHTHVSIGRYRPDYHEHFHLFQTALIASDNLKSSSSVTLDRSRGISTSQVPHL